MKILEPRTYDPAYEWCGERLIDWLSDPGGSFELCVMPEPRMVRWSDVSADPMSFADTVLRFHREQAVGSAPYVGRPFRYAWYHAIHNGVPVAAGMTRIRYEEWQ